MGIIHRLDDPGTHPDYILPEKPPLPPDDLLLLNEAMGPRDYSKEPFPKRLANRAAAFEAEIGFPTKGPWAKESYFNKESPGIHLCFIDEITVPPRVQKGQRKAEDDTVCIINTVNKLRDMGVCRKMPDNNPAYRVNPSFVLDTSGADKRMIIDVSSLAEYLIGTRFHYEQYVTFLLSITKDSWSWHSDLTKSYYLIEIWEGHWKYLGFNYYDENGLLVNMQMCALVMGANPACEIFTSYDRLLMRSIRVDYAANSYPFLDDTQGNEPTRERAKEVAMQVALRKAKGRPGPEFGKKYPGTCTSTPSTRLCAEN